MKYLLILLISVLFLESCFASEYPKTRLEKEIEDIGSLLDGEGLVFRPKKTKNSASKVKIGNVNKYLYNATIDVLDFAPLASADSNSGIIITDWYNSKNQPNTQVKINVFIKDGAIGPEAIDVKAYERTKVKGNWSKNHKDSAIAGILEDKIIRKARTLYQADR